MAARVDLDEGEMLLARAFRRLSSCRQDGPIPVTAIWQWQDRDGVATYGLRAFTETVIVSLDLRELTKMARKAKAPNRPPSPRRRGSKHV